MKESAGLYSHFFSLYDEEIKELSTNGIIWNNKKYNVDWMFSFDMATYWKITIGLEGFSPTKVNHEFCPYCTSKWGDRLKRGNKRCWFNRIFGIDHELDCYKFCFCAFHCDCRSSESMIITTYSFFANILDLSGFIIYSHILFNHFCFLLLFLEADEDLVNKVNNFFTEDLNIKGFKLKVKNNKLYRNYYVGQVKKSNQLTGISCYFL